MKKIIRLLPHATLILSLMVLTFFVIDRFNEYMAFMSSEISKWVIAGLALCRRRRHGHEISGASTG